MLKCKMGRAQRPRPMPAKSPRLRLHLTQPAKDPRNDCRVQARTGTFCQRRKDVKS